jgi:hypothetical protein
VQTWKKEKQPDETCPKCGSVYAVEARRFPARDEDKAICGVCDHVLRSWNDTVVYVYMLKKAGTKPAGA